MCAGPLNERPSPEGKGDSITARCSKVCRCALDLVLPWLGYSSESIPSPGTSICHRCGHKNITKQKEVMLCFKDRVQWLLQPILNPMAIPATAWNVMRPFYLPHIHMPCFCSASLLLDDFLLPSVWWHRYSMYPLHNFKVNSSIAFFTPTLIGTHQC